MNKYSPFAKTAPLLLFALLAVFLLHTVFSGAEIYRSVSEQETRNGLLRTASRYITTRTAQAEEVTAGEFHGLPTLMLWETVEGETFVTLVYCWDGQLRELFSLAAVSAEENFLPEDGERLLSLWDFDVQEDKGLLSITLTDGEDTVVLLHTQ